MSGGFTTVGAVLKMLDMTPHKKGKRTFIEKLPSTQNLDGGNLSALMGKMQSGGLGSLFKNPMAAIAGPLQQLIGAIAGAQGGSGGGAGSAPFVAALTGPGGLSEAVASITSAADRLSGVVAPGAGQYGLTDLALHEGVLASLGTSAPAYLSLATAAGPKTCNPVLMEIVDSLYKLRNGLQVHYISSKEAIQIIRDHTNKLNGIVYASNNAIATGEAMAQNVAQVHTVAGLLVSGSDELKSLLQDCLQPETLAAMNAAMADRLTIRPPDGTVAPSAPESTTICS